MKKLSRIETIWNLSPLTRQLRLFMGSITYVFVLIFASDSVFSSNDLKVWDSCLERPSGCGSGLFCDTDSGFCAPCSVLNNERFCGFFINYCPQYMQCSKHDRATTPEQSCEEVLNSTSTGKTICKNYTRSHGVFNKFETFSLFNEERVSWDDKLIGACASVEIKIKYRNQHKAERIFNFILSDAFRDKVFPNKYVMHILNPSDAYNYIGIVFLDIKSYLTCHKNECKEKAIDVLFNLNIDRNIIDTGGSKEVAAFSSVVAALDKPTVNIESWLKHPDKYPFIVADLNTHNDFHISNIKVLSISKNICHPINSQDSNPDLEELLRSQRESLNFLRNLKRSSPLWYFFLQHNHQLYIANFLWIKLRKQF